ncbi:MAG: response regulator transcription factor [Anaerolineae bacterium]
MTTIMLVEDDPLIVEFTEKNLIKDGFEVVVAATGNEALELLTTHRADIILLDILLPDMDGFEICRRIRQGEVPEASLIAADVPIVMLTARAEDAEKLRGFEMGVDDYITKPFNPLELTARLQAILRRTIGQEAQEVTEIGSLMINSTERIVLLKDSPLSLTPKEFDLLLLLARHPNRVFSREELLEKVWGYTFGNTRTVDEHVKRLRQKLDAAGLDWELITTVWGLGYKLQLEGETS